MGTVTISYPSRHAAVNTKHVLLWLLTALALATFGVEDAQGIQVSDEQTGDAAVASRPLASRDREPPLGSMSLDDSNNKTSVVSAEASDDQGELDVSLCLLLIVRDEAASLRANLPLWIDVADCFVIGIDDRTTDDTPHVIQEVLGGNHPRFIFFYTFQGFAQARNAVLRSTMQNFPDATHVIVADADWRPNLATIDKSELDFVNGSFRFLVHDHTGHTARVLGWLLRFDEGLRFKYRVHEVLDPIPAVEGASARSSKIVGWEVQVVESDSNWSSKFHQHSQSSERYRFDLNLLELDYEDDPTDLHTLFYLGITKFAYIESLMGKGTHQKTPELEALVTSGMSYFRQAVDLHGEMENSELVWGSKRWLAYGYQYFIGDAEEARAVYEDCIAYDPTRVDCTAFLSRLFLDNGDLDAAWTTAKAALLHRAPTSRVLNYFYLFECFVPAQAATVISKRISASGSVGLGNDSLEGLLTTGWYLLRHHRDHCNRGVMVDSPEDIDRLEGWFQETIAQEGVDVQEIKRIVLLDKDGSPLLGGLLRTWGTGSKASTTWSLQARQGAQGQHPEGELQEQQPHRQNREKESGGNEEEREEERTSAADAADAATDGLARELAEPARPSSHSGGGGERHKDLDERGVGEGYHEADATGGEGSSRGSAVTAENCEKIVGEARTRLGLGVEVVTGALAATSVAQLDAARATSAGHEQQYFRALVLGGGVGSSAGGLARGLELEELLQVVSLILQLSSRASSEVTYVHPEPSVVEAARSVASSCANELGINGGQVRLDFACSTPADFLGTTAIDRQFDYVDVGGPLSLGAKGANNEKVSSASATPAVAAVPDTGAPVVLDSATLRLVGQKLAPGAHLRAWAFAANPSTEFVFRAARKAAAAADDNDVQDVGTRTTVGTNQDQAGTGKKTGSLVNKILRKAFRIGQTGAPAKEMVSGTTPVPVRAGTAEEEAWARQVSAGGDKLTVSDVAGLLADGGFELMLVLGKNAAERGEAAAAARARAADIAEMLKGGLSRWEIEDFEDSLELTPALVHQVLAVRRDHGSTTTAVT